MSEESVVSNSGTHGFLFADLRGFTSYVDRRGAIAATELLDRFRTVVRRAVAAHQGAEIRTEGDSFYIVFPSASMAVACALAIVRDATDVAGGDPIPVGVGVHAGEALDTAEGPVGTAVNVAARLCALAAPGQVLVSETVRSLTRSIGHAAFARAGRRRIKGLDEPITVYRALPADAVLSPPRRVRPGMVAALVAATLVLAGLAGLGLPWALRLSADSPSESATPPTVTDAWETAARNFSVPFAIDLGPEWQVHGDRADLSTFYHPDSPRGWIDVILVQAVLEPPCQESTPEFVGPRPEDLIAWLTERSWIDHDAPRPYNVGPYAGRAVEIQVIDDDPAAACRSGGGAPTFFRLGAPDARDNFGYVTAEIGERKRVIAIDVDGRTVTLLLGSPDATVEQFWELAEPRIQTIRFTDS